jgi:hypothetical protein
MTDLRTAAQQALEALKALKKRGVFGDFDGVIDALHAEIEQPVQKPVAFMYKGIKSDGTEHGPHLVWAPAYMDAMSAEKGVVASPLFTHPPQAEPPLAWRYQAQGRWLYVDKNPNLWQDKPDGEIQPLYAQQTTDFCSESKNAAILTIEPDLASN